MQYNTMLEKIVLPEYGRNIQQMAQYILTIEDREKRNQAAREIISVMGNMTPQYKDSRDFKQKLWDHLALMTNYELDVDYPYEINRVTRMAAGEKLPYAKGGVKLRHYGRIIQKLVEKAVSETNPEAKNELIRVIANHMKRQYVQWNNNTVNDAVILQDLRYLSNGRLQISADMKLSNVRYNNNNNNNQRRNNNNNNNKNRFKNRNNQNNRNNK